MKKISYEQPKSGVFYIVPDPKKVGSYTIYTEVQEHDGEDVLHLFLFDRVRKLLETRFKVKLGLLDAYTGIPRGRIIDPGDRHGTWLVTHGGDFPLDKYRDAILSEFSLHDALQLGKVRFEVTTHEKMGYKDQKNIEGLLGIKITPEGWKNV